MEILTRDQLDGLLELYQIDDTVDTFLFKSINKFPLSEDELKLAFQIIDRAFIKWY
jgi:hypothetical protein